MNNVNNATTAMVTMAGLRETMDRLARMPRDVCVFEGSLARFHAALDSWGIRAYDGAIVSPGYSRPSWPIPPVPIDSLGFWEIDGVVWIAWSYRDVEAARRGEIPYRRISPDRRCRLESTAADEDWARYLRAISNRKTQPRKGLPMSTPQPQPQQMSATAIVGFLVPVVKVLLQQIPPGTRAYNLGQLVLGIFGGAAADANAGHAPGGALSLPAHLPQLPPQSEWTEEGLLAFADRHARAYGQQQPGA